MHSELEREDIGNLIGRVRALIEAAALDGDELISRGVFTRVEKALLDMHEQLGLRVGGYFDCDADLDNAARICVHYAESARVLRDELSAASGEDRGPTSAMALSGHVAELFRSLACAALLLSRSKAHLQLYANQDESHINPHEGVSAADELGQLFEATILRYEQGRWRTAAHAARHITPEIVELAAQLANKRAGRPLLRWGTSKPLEWIRRHRRSKA